MKKNLHRLAPILTVVALFATTVVFAPHSKADEYWDRKVSQFDSLPVYPEDIVFLGNSITDGGNFAEWFDMPNIKNRGISSDVMPGVSKRLKQVTSGHPKKIFLLIGINDVSHNLTLPVLLQRYETLVDSIIAESPDTKLYIQSVMPINNDFKRYKTLYGKEQTVLDFNKGIKEIADKRGVTFIDLWPFLANQNGKMKKEYTNDGLHLTGAGYRAWTRGIESYVKE